jgi:hypothetical protein
MTQERELLQNIIASSDANDGGSLVNAIEEAREWLEDLGRVDSQRDLAQQRDVLQRLKEWHDMMQRLKEWHDTMGGWDALVWRQLEAALEHPHIGVGFCPICKHYGDDCTGVRS